MTISDIFAVSGTVTFTEKRLCSLGEPIKNRYRND